MVVLDSSAWIEHIFGGPLSARVKPYIDKMPDLITPSIVLYEVYKKAKRERGEEAALEVVAFMKETTVVPLDEATALSAADVSLDKGIPMADAIIYATALKNSAIVVTCDEHFADFEHAVYLPKAANS